MPLPLPPASADDETLLRRLRMFLAVIDHGGVSEAAKAVGISQPAISNHIKSLEADLGTTLFRRTGRRLMLNDKGSEIAELARKSVWTLGTTLRGLRELAGNSGGLLRFGFSAPHTALEAAERFRASDSATRLEFTAANSGHLYHALDSFEVDIIMVGVKTPPKGYVSQFYKRQSMAVMLPRAHRLAGSETLGLAELADIPIVLREEGSSTRAALMEAFASAGLSPQIAFEVATREAVAEAVKRGFGVGPVLDQEAERSPDLVTLPLRETHIFTDDYLVCHKDSLRYGPVQRFFDVNKTTAPDAGPTPARTAR